MAKAKKLPLPGKSESAAPSAALEAPKFKWTIVYQIAGVAVVMWALAILLIPYVGYWGVGAMGVATAALIGFGIWLWNMMKKQGRLAQLLNQAGTTEEGRQAAIEQLAAEDKGDGMNAMARAQLVARDDPKEAIKIMEAINIEKAQALIQDDIRANLAYLYLATGRVKDSRPVTDKIKYEAGPTAKQKAMYAAVVAESKARTGDAADAKRIIDAVNILDAEIAELLPIVHRAQVFTYLGTKNRGLAKRAMTALVLIDPNHLAPFMMARAVTPEQIDMQKMAKEVLTEANYQTRPKTKMIRQ